MPITREQICHVARLARLTLSKTETTSIKRDLESMLGHFETIESVSTNGSDYSDRLADSPDSIRPDQPREDLPRSEVLRNAPEQDGRFFIVPRVIE